MGVEVGWMRAAVKGETVGGNDKEAEVDGVGETEAEQEEEEEENGKEEGLESTRELSCNR